MSNPITKVQGAIKTASAGVQRVGRYLSGVSTVDNYKNPKSALNRMRSGATTGAAAAPVVKKRVLTKPTARYAPAKPTRAAYPDISGQMP